MMDVEQGTNTFLIRPSYEHRFRVPVVKECIKEILKEQLSGAKYDPEETPSLTRTLAEAIKNRVKGLDLERYKLVVQVLIAEQRGQGVKMMSRCFWDSDTDRCAKEVYINDSIVCVAAVFGVYNY
ncbi:dynein light chain Tctex-type protein 2B isoform X2 [Neoarius graeffei]|uniref:dynein light chain Tctex-type protein 2B isoform X2 n=1 Tax=Neoarius graeffei TaxID=443677 RepID=UPI00298BE80D|nr:dynein light chain Tctex-type protein 2B isoform X2 [Neoarius graeffei]